MSIPTKKCEYYLCSCLNKCIVTIKTLIFNIETT